MSCATLAELQQLLQSSLLQPENLEVVDHICGSPRLTAREHLGIYQKSYIARLQKCMAAQFSALCYALGDSLFSLFVTGYVRACPSDSHTLDDLGARFADYLRQTRPDAGQDLKEDWPDFMIELAEFEYTLGRLFDADDVDSSLRAFVDTPDELLALQPVHQLFRHRFPIVAYYQSFKAEQSPDLPQLQTSFAIVVRNNYKLGLFSLSPAQYRFLTLFERNQSIEQTIEQLHTTCALPKDELKDAWQLWRERWIEYGILVLKH